MGAGKKTTGRLVRGDCKSAAPCRSGGRRGGRGVQAHCQPRWTVTVRALVTASWRWEGRSGETLKGPECTHLPGISAPGTHFRPLTPPRGPQRVSLQSSLLPTTVNSESPGDGLTAEKRSKRGHISPNAPPVTEENVLSGQGCVFSTCQAAWGRGWPHCSSQATSVQLTGSACLLVKY